MTSVKENRCFSIVYDFYDRVIPCFFLKAIRHSLIFTCEIPEAIFLQLGLKGDIKGIAGLLLDGGGDPG